MLDEVTTYAHMRRMSGSPLTVAYAQGYADLLGIILSPLRSCKRWEYIVMKYCMTDRASGKQLSLSGSARPVAMFSKAARADGAELDEPSGFINSSKSRIK